MTPEERAEIQADLVAQGFDDVSPEDVETTFGLYRNHEAFDPEFSYDPTAGPPDIYAPTAAEMHPDLTPPGWPNG